LRRNIGEDSGRLANLVSQLAKLGVNEMPGVTPKNNCLVGTPDDFYNLLRGRCGRATDASYISRLWIITAIALNPANLR
jgi:hypothetical protein